MDFNDFSKRIVKIKNLDLPGVESHYKMEPEARKAVRERLDFSLVQPKKAAVMALFYPSTVNVTRLLLILRKTYKGVHSNQIGFPGGKVEKTDSDILDTALRETFEEVGIVQGDITVLKKITEVYIPPSNFLVHPFIGLYGDPKPFTLQESEVEALVEVNLFDFLDDANEIEQRMSASYADNILVPAFQLNGYTVWGATAMMLSEVKALLQKVL